MKLRLALLGLVDQQQYFLYLNLKIWHISNAILHNKNLNCYYIGYTV